jgi:hypothetical protein
MPAFTPHFTYYWRLNASALNDARDKAGLRFSCEFGLIFGPFLTTVSITP